MRYVNARPNALAIAALRPHAGERVLELGCGPGYALKDLLTYPQIKEVIGIDHSELMLREAKRLNSRATTSRRLKLVRCDFSALPFGPRSIDSVLAVNVAYFMKDASAVIEARRVLRPGGHLILYATMEEAMERWHFAGPASHRLYDDIEMKALLHDGGFKPELIHVDVVSVGFGVRGLLAVAQNEHSDEL